MSVTFVPYNFIANFVTYISAKYYLNWVLISHLTRKS